jgi:tetratricopeptide (TPR) repeat protein
MLRPKKKITKRELKHDPVVSAYERGMAFYYENKKYISYSITAIIVLIIATVVYANNRRASNERATAELGKVFQYYDAGQYQQAIDGMPESGVMGLRNIVENYVGPSAELARFYLANCYYSVGNYDEALYQFKNFDGRGEVLVASALAGAGACYDAKGDHPNAARYYEKAFEASPNSPLGPEYLHLSARHYALAGQKDRALTLFRRIKKDYPNSSYAREVDRYIVQYSM